MINCDLCDNCPMVDSNEEYHEIHITAEITDNNKQNIETIFSNYGGKLTTIEVGNGEYQSMSSIVVKGTRKKAGEIAKKVVDNLNEMGYKVIRKKLECSLFNSDFSDELGYYEGHIAVKSDHIDIVKSICFEKGFHFSKNVRKDDIIMVSLRVYNDYTLFETKLNNTVDSLVLSGAVPVKIMKEFCYFDNNENYDKRFFEKGYL